MNELSLFSGGGGGLLASHLLGWKTIGAVEIDEYCRKILLARQRDGYLPQFPIWDDIRTFNGKPWRGTVDVVSGGFPCQDISSAGTRQGLTGDRSGLVFEMLRIVGEVRPQFVFAENSPHLRTRGLGVIIQELAGLGYDCRWCVLGAGHIGAPHQRNRMWIVAHSASKRRESRGKTRKAQKRQNIDATNSYNNGKRAQPLNAKMACTSPSGSDATNPHSETVREQSRGRSGQDGPEAAVSRGTDWWSLDPFEGVDDGLAQRMVRVRATGNGQVPRVAQLAWQILTQGEVS